MLAEPTTYSFFMDELLELEKSVRIFVRREGESTEEKDSLLRELRALKDENEILRIKLEEAEGKSDIGDFDNSFLNSDKKAVVKDRIDELINKIDNHLRS